MTDARLNTRLGNYRLVQYIGKGGYANVYLGEHITLGTYAAIKVLRTKYAASEEKVAQFYGEARLMAHLSNHRIVQVSDCSDRNNGENTHFFVMAYAPHGSLRQFCKQDNLLPLPVVIKYIKQIAEALQYVHDRGYIHRDVKPENILLDVHRNIWLCDFGIAIAIPVSPYEHVHDVGGTVEYMAPEQLRRGSVPASDQYALAIVTYVLLVGDCPFHGTSTEVAQQQKHVHPPSLRVKMPSIPPTVERVVLKALSKDPRMRYPNVWAYATALEQAYQAYDERPLPSRHHPANIHVQPLRMQRPLVDVQSQPVMSHQLAVDKQSEPLRSCQSSNAIHSEPLPFRRRKQLGATMPLQSREVRRPAPLIDGLVQPAQPHYQQKSRAFPVQALDVLELVGRVAADVSISLVLGGAMFAGGFGYGFAVSLAVAILLVLLSLSLLDGWATIVIAAILLALPVAAGTIFHSIIIFWIAVVYMLILAIIVISIKRRN
ncbi:MAG TPA: serine/threonine-protein kinase [Ktedonobacteraceae bacterium]|nr:serine/threonine-protein kinase [Ktedonobacteraceae bacterium]